MTASIITEIEGVPKNSLNSQIDAIFSLGFQGTNSRALPVQAAIPVGSSFYLELIEKRLKLAIKSKRRCLPTSGVVLQHDNARPYTTRKTLKITEFRLECVSHPACSPDLPPSHLHALDSSRTCLVLKNSVRTIRKRQRYARGWTVIRNNVFLPVFTCWCSAGAPASCAVGTLKNHKMFFFFLIVNVLEIEKIFKVAF